MTPSEDIRSLVAHLVREQINDVIREELAVMTGVVTEGDLTAAHTIKQTSRSASAAAHTTVQPAASGVSTTRAKSRGERVEQVHITSDAELNSFARQLLHLFENPKNRDDVRQGRLTFRLHTPPHGSTSLHGMASVPGSRLVDSGVVSERAVVQAARDGVALAVAPGVVVTPLALDKARSLNVHIERETR